jgi:uncharacterized protein (DUF983 family)
MTMSFELERAFWPAVRRGFARRCPACGEGRAFDGLLKVRDACQACGQELHHHRADDAPPYFTILIVGHIVVPLALMVEQTLQPELWLHMALWPPLTLGLSLALLPRIKGALIGVQWSQRMHGFGDAAADD